MAEIERLDPARMSDYASEFAANSEEGFGDRMMIALGSESTHAFSKRTGIPDSTLRNYLKGSMPGLRKLIEIAEATGVSLDWLVRARGPVRVSGAVSPLFLELGGGDPQDFTLVPRLEVTASAGHGLVALAEEVVERLAFRTDWLHDMGLSPAYVALVTCRGDSQDPVIRDGALMLVDTRPDQHIRSGCFYIIVLDGDVLVKLMNRRIDGTVELISHNPAYPKEIVDSQQLDRLTIPGRVVWYGQKL